MAGDRTLSEDIFVGGWDDNLSLGVKVANFGWLLPVSLAAGCLFELNEGYESFFEAAESFIAIGVRGDGVALAVDDDVLVVGGGGDGDAIVKIIEDILVLARDDEGARLVDAAIEVCFFVAHDGKTVVETADSAILGKCGCKCFECLFGHFGLFLY